MDPAHKLNWTQQDEAELDQLEAALDRNEAERAQLEQRYGELCERFEAAMVALNGPLKS